MEIKDNLLQQQRYQCIAVAFIEVNVKPKTKMFQFLSKTMMVGLHARDCAKSSGNKR